MPVRRPWFLEDETWAKMSCHQGPACTSDADPEPSIRAVDEMPHAWAAEPLERNCTSETLRGRLASRRTSRITTSAAYASRTPAVNETILQIAQDRAVKMAKSSFGIVKSLSVMNNPERAQALFVYRFMPLFNRSVKWRVLAERILAVLR